MNRQLFQYKVKLLPFHIENQEQEAFRNALNQMPYLLYEVEQLKDGQKIAVNKPGGKRSFGRFSRDDFMVFIYNPAEESLWLISHDEIFKDIQEKYAHDPNSAKQLIKGLYKVCKGKEPDKVIKKLGIKDTVGIPAEAILKAYKWIWGQEDCNYPSGEGRWRSMNHILNQFKI